MIRLVSGGDAFLLLHPVYKMRVLLTCVVVVVVVVVVVLVAVVVVGVWCGMRCRQTAQLVWGGG